MKIVELGQRFQRCKCYYCNTVVDLESSDIKADYMNGLIYRTYLVCPMCQRKNTI